ncbi:MAG: helix-turn-helix domain-containing protein [Pseudomonadales bacterium]|jgi:ribosome-binding protein aMBF1 (putative translation factor)
MQEQDPFRHIRELARSMQSGPVDEPTRPTAEDLKRLPPLPPIPLRKRRARRAEADDVPRRIAAALKAARLRKGTTQRDLGLLIGVPQSHISKIEAGTVDLRISSLMILAEALDLTLELEPAPERPRSAEG